MISASRAYRQYGGLNRHNLEHMMVTQSNTTSPRFRFVSACLLATVILISTPGVSLAADSEGGGGSGSVIMILESSLTYLDPAASELLGCKVDGARQLHLSNDGLRCDGQLDFDLLDTLCSAAGGLCIVDNIGGRVIQGCTGEDGEIVEDGGIVEVDVIQGRYAAMDHGLSWEASTEALRACDSCGNFSEISTSIDEAIRACPDIDQDGASDLVSYQGRLRCAPLDPQAPPVIEQLTLTVTVPCSGDSAEASEPSIERVLDALIARTARNVLITQDGGLGIEIAIDSM